MTLNGYIEYHVFCVKNNVGLCDVIETSLVILFHTTFLNIVTP